MTTHHLGSTARTAAFDTDFKKAPRVHFAALEPDTEGAEHGASVLVGEGLALGAASVGYVHDVVALDAKTGAPKWRHTPSKKQCWPTSHFALADGVAYLATNQGLHALDAQTGEPRWLAKLSGATGAPVVLDGVAVIGAKKGLFALDLAKKARKKWTFALKTAVGGAVAALDGTLYFIADATLFALSATDQDVLWKTPASSYCRIGPVVDATHVYYLLDTNVVGCVDRAKGKVAWQRKLPESMTSGGFALGGGLLVVKDATGGLHALDAKSGKVKWTQAPGEGAFGNGGLIISGASVITVREDGGKTTLCAWDLATGKQRWALGAEPVVKALAAAQKKAGSDHKGAWNNNATPFVADGLLYAQTDAGIVALK